jgi:hypothetical protein
MHVSRLMAGLILALVMLCGCRESKKNFDESFKQSFETSFVKSCTESATKTGAPEAKATGKCSCVAKHLVNKYSVTELENLGNTDDPESQKIMKQALEACK